MDLNWMDWKIYEIWNIVYKNATPVDTEMGNKMTDGGMSVGLLCSVIGHTVGFKQG